MMVNKAKFGCLSLFVGKSHDEIHNVHDDSKNRWIVPNVQEFMSVCPYLCYKDLR